MCEDFEDVTLWPFTSYYCDRTSRVPLRVWYLEHSDDFGILLFVATPGINEMSIAVKLANDVEKVDHWDKRQMAAVSKCVRKDMFLKPKGWLRIFKTVQGSGQNRRILLPVASSDSEAEVMCDSVY